MEIPVIKKFRRLNFAVKLMIVYICALFLSIGLVTYNQIHASAKILKEESAQNLKMLTEQVALNFRENQESLGYSIYSKMAALEIPSLMDAYVQRESAATRADVRHALTQMITDSSDYDYVLLEMLDGTRIHTDGGKYHMPSAVKDNSAAILDTHRSVTYGNSNWYRGTDGGVYILRMSTPYPPCVGWARL